jgi:hypothetical protein
LLRSTAKIGLISNLTGENAKSPGVGRGCLC